MAYPNIDTLLISPADMKNFGLIDANIEEHELLPIISYEQDEIVRDILGVVLYEKLLQLVKTGDIDKEENQKYKELLDGYIFKILSHRVKGSLAFERSRKVRNAGTGTSNNASFQNDTIADVNKVKDYYFNKSDKYVIDLERFLRCNYNYFSEFSEFTNWFDNRTRSNNWQSKIYFRRSRCGCCRGGDWR